MRISTMGDLAQTQQSRRQYADLSRQQTRLTEEVATGLRADRGRAVGGDFTALAGIERSLAVLASHDLAAREAELATGAVQAALGSLQDAAQVFSGKIAGGLQTPGATAIRTLAAEARERLDAGLSALNVQSGDRYLLSGTATDQRPLIDGAALLAALGTATAGLPAVSDVTAAVDAWFDAPAGGGGFLDIAYGGAATPLAPFSIGPEDRAAMTLTAADPALREMLKGLATAALVDTGTFAGNPQAQAQLLRAGGDRLLSADAGLIDLRAALGTVEARIGEAQSANGASRTALSLERNALVSADPYDAATELEAVQTRIETLYTLTVRLSRLTLADLLR
jgi:flagellar hook-associated protein 3 FlgL